MRKNKFTKILVLGFTWISLLLFPFEVKAAGASLSLTPATKNVAVGETFNVDLILETGGQAVSSVSAILNYDPKLLSPVVIPGTTLLLPKSSVSLGVMTLGSGVLAPSFTGASATLATINFKALKSGTANVSIVFTGSASGSSIVIGANGVSNILSTVNGGTYVVGTGGSVTTKTSTSIKTTTTVPTTGVIENTILAIIAGLVLIGISGWSFVWTLNKK